jgi:hypothetical protein
VKKGLRTILILTLAFALILASLPSPSPRPPRAADHEPARPFNGLGGVLHAVGRPVALERFGPQQITWESSNDFWVSVTPTSNPRKAVVTVRDALPTYPDEADKVLITARTPGGKTATCTITIKQVLVKRIDVTPSSKTVYLTDSAPTYQMATPKFTPSVAETPASPGRAATTPVATVDESTAL